MIDELAQSFDPLIVVIDRRIDQFLKVLQTVLGFVSLFATLLALMLLAAGAPAWLAVLVFAVHIPWNLVLLVGVWRSAGRPEVSPAAANLARLMILIWVAVLSVL